MAVAAGSFESGTARGRRPARREQIGKDYYGQGSAAVSVVVTVVVPSALP
jgi:hypothetical protein